jgi:outer membrane receptor protein involved in Fe transport
VSRIRLEGAILAVLLVWASVASAQQAGSIRGTVYDDEFKTPVGGVQVLILETKAKTVTGDEGNFFFTQVPPGTYTLVFSKEGFMRQMKPNVAVAASQMTEAEIWLAGELAEMDAFIVQDVEIGGTGTEQKLLDIRNILPSLTDSISIQNIKLAGASTAVDALPLITGTTIQDGKYAVVRGLPDRYVSSQMNGVRLPTADENKRAVQLDQFPSAVIESIQVTKTFTPDQQGDSSGGAVNLVLKGVPDETILSFNMKTTYNRQVQGRNDFLTYKNGGLNFWGIDDGGRKLPAGGVVHPSVVGVSNGDSPIDYDWSFSAGGKHQVNPSLKVGGFANFFYRRDSSYHNDGIDDSWWVTSPGAGLSPKTSQGSPQIGEFKTSLFDVTQGSQQVQWGALGVVGLETRAHAISLTYMYTHAAEDQATLAQDTRGKYYFFPTYNPKDPDSDGYWQVSAAPFERIETLQYTERETATLQLKGHHILPFDDWGSRDKFLFLAPELDWTLAGSSSSQYQPDKRMFASWWHPLLGGAFVPLKALSSFTIGNFQDVWRDINEDSNQYSVNLKMPFSQWSHDEGYLKFGVFHDKVHRTFNQDSYSNLREPDLFYLAPWDSSWSAVWPTQNHAPVVDSLVSVDYTGDQEIGALYYMADVPLTNYLNVIGGVRYETTQLATTLSPQPNATKIVPLADANYNQKDVLPSVGFSLKILDDLTLRGSYAETVARQTFKELTPIMYQEYLGGDVFIGNPDLRMSALKNSDLRVDYTPYKGSLFSASYFAKDVKDPIEYVQAIGDIGGSFIYTTARNYPKGTIRGIELEARQQMEDIWEPLTGLSLAANATFIDSNVILPKDEADAFNSPALKAPMTSRDMTNAPKHLYNFSVTYDLGQALSAHAGSEAVRKAAQDWGTQFALFYTVRGDALVAGAAQDHGNFVPNVYEKQYGALNASVVQKLGKYVRLTFQAKNLSNPKIQEVYRSDYSGPDKVKTSYTKGVDLSVGISVEFNF